MKIVINGVEISPRVSNRAALIGMTGSGKTTLAQIFLSSFPFAVVHDAKGLIKWRGYRRHRSLSSLFADKNYDVENVNGEIREFQRLIYAPGHAEQRDTVAVNEFFRWVYERRRTALYVDEVYRVCRRAEIPEFYHAILTQGREYDITTLSSMQRPKLIPQVVLSESGHFYVFRLLLEPDREKVKETLGFPTERQQALRTHQFLYATETGARMGPIRLRLGR